MINLPQRPASPLFAITTFIPQEHNPLKSLPVQQLAHPSLQSPHYKEAPAGNGPMELGFSPLARPSLQSLTRVASAGYAPSEPCDFSPCRLDGPLGIASSNLCSGCATASVPKPGCLDSRCPLPASPSATLASGLFDILDDCNTADLVPQDGG